MDPNQDLLYPENKKQPVTEDKFNIFQALNPFDQKLTKTGKQLQSALAVGVSEGAELIGDVANNLGDQLHVPAIFKPTKDEEGRLKAYWEEEHHPEGHPNKLKEFIDNFRKIEETDNPDILPTSIIGKGAYGIVAFAPQAPLYEFFGGPAGKVMGQTLGYFGKKYGPTAAQELAALLAGPLVKANKIMYEQMSKRIAGGIVAATEGAATQAMAGHPSEEIATTAAEFGLSTVAMKGIMDTFHYSLANHEKIKPMLKEGWEWYKNEFKDIKDKPNPYNKKHEESIERAKRAKEFSKTWMTKQQFVERYGHEPETTQTSLEKPSQFDYPGEKESRAIVKDEVEQTREIREKKLQIASGEVPRGTEEVETIKGTPELPHDVELHSLAFLNPKYRQETAERWNAWSAEKKNRAMHYLDINAIPTSSKAGYGDELVRVAAAGSATNAVVSDLVGKAFKGYHEEAPYWLIKKHFDGKKLDPDEQKIMAQYFFRDRVTKVLIKDRILNGYKEFIDKSKQFRDSIHARRNDLNIINQEIEDILSQNLEPHEVVNKSKELYDKEKTAKTKIEEAITQEHRYRKLAHDVAEAHDLVQYNAQVLSTLRDPEIVRVIQDIGDHIESEINALYARTHGMNDVIDLEGFGGTGLYSGVRIPLIHANYSDPLYSAHDHVANRTNSPQQRTSEASNAHQKRDAQDKFAHYTGEYTSNIGRILRNVIGPKLFNSTRLDLYEKMVKTGNAVITAQDAATPKQIDGVGVVSHPIQFRERNPETGKFETVNKTITMKDTLWPEFHDALAMYRRGDKIPFTGAITAYQLMQPADFTTHVFNMMTEAINSQGRGSKMKDAFAQLPFMGLDSIKEAYDIHQELKENSPDVKPGRTKSIREERRWMAENGLLRTVQHHNKYLDKLGKAMGMDDTSKLMTGEILLEADTAVRIIMNRRFDTLVKTHRAADTGQNRRNFINQVGQYNERLMTDLMRGLRKISPFATAATTFSKNAIKWTVGEPGFDAPNKREGFQNRVIQMIQPISIATIPMAIHYAIFGNVAGPPGTPMGTIAIPGTQDKEGNYLLLNLGFMTPSDRAGRLTGEGAAWTLGVGTNQTKTQVANKMIEDMTRGWGHIVLSPAVQFTATSIQGHPIDPAPRPDVKKTEGLKSEEKLKEAIRQTNPLLGTSIDSDKHGTGYLETKADEHEAGSAVRIGAKALDVAVGSLSRFVPIKRAAHVNTKASQMMKDDGYHTAEAPDPKNAYSQKLTDKAEELLREDPIAGHEFIMDQLSKELISPKQAQRAEREFNMTPIQKQFNKAPFEKLMKYYANMTEEEQEQTKKMLLGKYDKKANEKQTTPEQKGQMKKDLIRYVVNEEPYE